MRYLLLFMVSALVGCNSAAQTQIDQTLVAIQQDLEQKVITRVDVLRLSYSCMTFIAVTPETLENNADQRIRIDSTSKHYAELCEALKRTDFWYSDSDPGEVRLGLLFRQSDGTTRHSIFVDRPYLFIFARAGAVDGQYVRVSGDLICWADRLLDQADSRRPR